MLVLFAASSPPIGDKKLILHQNRVCRMFTGSYMTHWRLQSKGITEIRHEVDPRICLTMSSSQENKEEKLAGISERDEKDVNKQFGGIKLGPRGVSLLAIWAIFLLYTFFFAPGEGSGAVSPVLTEIIKHPLQPDINIIYRSIFNLLGVTGAVYIALLASAENKQTVPFGPFAFAGLILGYIGIGPYLALRRFCPERIDKTKLTWLGRLAESKAFAFGMVVFSLVFYAIALGILDEAEMRDALFYTRTSDLVALFNTDRLVNSSLIDFTLLSTLMWGPLTEDMQRRRLFNEKNLLDAFTAVIILAAPALGPSLYLLLRPPLEAREMKE